MVEAPQPCNPETMPNSKVDVLVIGAGPTGLGAASRLQQQKADWLLVDANEEAGGLACTDVTPEGFLFDMGGHVIFSHFEFFDQLIDSAVGVGEAHWAEHQYGSLFHSSSSFVFAVVVTDAIRLRVLRCWAAMARAAMLCDAASHKSSSDEEGHRHPMHPTHPHLNFLNSPSGASPTSGSRSAGCRTRSRTTCTSCPLRIRSSASMGSLTQRRSILFKDVLGKEIGAVVWPGPRDLGCCVATFGFSALRVVWRDFRRRWINSRRAMNPSVHKLGFGLIFKNRILELRDRSLNSLFSRIMHRLCLPNYPRSAAKPSVKPANFDEWILRVMGTGIADIFMRPYNFKVWAVPTTKMQCEWLGERVATVDAKGVIEKVLRNEPSEGWGPNAVFRFPQEGGTGGIWKKVMRLIWAQLTHEGPFWGSAPLPASPSACATIVCH